MSPWESRERGGRYYTRSRKVDGRIVREYVGSGPIAALAAQMDALERRQREEEAKAWREEKEHLEALDGPVEELCEAAEILGPRRPRGRGLPPTPPRGMEEEA